MRGFGTITQVGGHVPGTAYIGRPHQMVVANNCQFVLCLLPLKVPYYEPCTYMSVMSLWVK